MKTELRKNFKQFKNPFLSDIVCFCMAVKSQGYNKKFIKENFLKLVTKGDYHKEDLNVVLDNLWVVAHNKTKK